MKKPIATCSRTKEILTKFNQHAKKGYGQNFIIEPGIVAKIAQQSMATDVACIEIGPGIGALTEQLCLVAKYVRAYEIDSSLLEVLAYSLADYSNYEVINEDFLKIDLEQSVQELKAKYKQVVVSANLPYYITTPILFKIFESKAPIDYITVMMQKEVGDRFTAQIKTKEYNALSVIVQYLYDVKMLMKIPRTIFNPKPNVESCIIQFKPKHPTTLLNQEQEFFSFVKTCFTQRRKTLVNNLKKILTSEQIENLLTTSQLKQTVRAEELTLEQFINLFKIAQGEDYER